MKAKVLSELKVGDQFRRNTQDVHTWTVRNIYTNLYVCEREDGMTRQWNGNKWCVYVD